MKNVYINNNNDKVVAITWNEYNNVVDSVMKQMLYGKSYSKLELIKSTMDLIKSTTYSVELDLGKAELCAENGNVDISMYAIYNNGEISLYLNSNYLDVVHSCTTSMPELYSDMKDLIAKLIDDPIA